MDKQQSLFGFEVMRILDCGFSIEEAINPQPGNVLIGYGMNFVFDVENSWVQYGIRADFKDNETKQSFMTGTVLTRFGIDNLSQFLDENDNVMFPEGSLEALFGIAFNHMRAILSKNVSGSKFQNIIVPVIIPRDLFPELLQINIEKFNEFKASAGVENQQPSDIADFQIKEKKSKIKLEEKQHMEKFENIDLAPTNSTPTIEEQLRESRERITKLKEKSGNMLSENSKKEIKQKS
ncbi:MAG TPA: hypothetical protein VK796_11160 [Cytophaga sp.]|nr:hypothetical protein [Cytophaga sp.]